MISFRSIKCTQCAGQSTNCAKDCVHRGNIMLGFGVCVPMQLHAMLRLVDVRWRKGRKTMYVISNCLATLRYLHDTACKVFFASSTTYGISYQFIADFP